MSGIRKILVKVYQSAMPRLQVYAPTLWAKIQYIRVYRKRCNLKNPQTFSEKLLWLWLNDYRNRTIMEMNDKHDVRRYLKAQGLEDILNELYFVTDDPDSINYEALPDRFALKLSQGWNTNLICSDKSNLTPGKLRDMLNTWNNGQKYYDLAAAKLGNIDVRELPKHYICERYLSNSKGETPSDYKIYCFHGEPKAILWIADRFETKKGCFMTVDWEFLSDLDAKYQKITQLPERPGSLKEMLEVAKIISKPFPFVRVDLYDIDGHVVFGETTFFPNGCTGMQETTIDGVPMAKLLHLETD